MKIETLLLVLAIVLVLFGAKRIPDIASSFGRGIREFKRNVKDGAQPIRDGAPETANRATARQDPARPAASGRAEPKRLI